LHFEIVKCKNKNAIKITPKHAVCEGPTMHQKYSSIKRAAEVVIEGSYSVEAGHRLGMYAD
jgi:hypothetical protein